MYVRPDWRDTDHYSFLQGHQLDVLAWEFVRRNPDYQKDCAEFLAVAPDVRQWHSFCVGASGLDNPEVAAMGESVRDVYRRFRAHWRLLGPKDPNEDFYNPDSDAPIFDLDFFSHFTHIDKWLPISGPKVLLPVDLSMPLESIKETVMGAIKEMRAAGIAAGSIKPVTERVLAEKTYIEHLRILDGVAAGADLPEIGQVLQPKAVNDPESKQRDKRIRAAYKAALKMQADGWQVLLQ